MHFCFLRKSSRGHVRKSLASICHGRLRSTLGEIHVPADEVVPQLSCPDFPFRANKRPSKLSSLVLISMKTAVKIDTFIYTQFIEGQKSC